MAAVGPAPERSAIDGGMNFLVVFVFAPGLKTPIEFVDIIGFLQLEGLDEGLVDVPEKPFDFATSWGIIGFSMNDMDAENCSDALDLGSVEYSPVIAK